MEDSWRFQAARANLCPSCRVSHFPFCSPPRPLYGNGYPPDDPLRFPPEALPFHRPFHAPLLFSENRRMSPPPHPKPTAPRSADPWSRYPLREREPFAQPFFPTERLLSEDFLEMESFHKRMRVDEGFPGYSVSPKRPDRYGTFPNMISSEDERRLNLIRDHGRAQVNLPFDGDQRINGVPVGRYPHVDSRSSYVWSGTDRDLHGVGSGVAGSNDPVTPNSLFFGHKNDALWEGSYGGYQDLKGPTSFRDVDRFVHLADNELERRDWDASNIVRSNSSYGGIKREQYGQSEAPSYPFRSYGYDDVAAESSKNYMVHHKPEVEFKYKQNFNEEPVSNLQKQVPDSSPYAVSQGSRGMLSHQQHFQQTSVSERLHPHTNGYQTPFASNIGHYGIINHVAHERVQSKHEPHVHESEGPQSFEPTVPLREDSFRTLDFPSHRMISQFNAQTNQRGSLPMQSDNIMVASMEGQVQSSQTLPPTPPHHFLRPPPPDPSMSHFQVSSSSMNPPPTVSPFPAGLSVDVPHAVRDFSEAPTVSEPYFRDGLRENTSTGVVTERLPPLIPQIPSKRHAEESQTFPLRHALANKKTIINASDIFCQPHRATRPDHIVVILRGLPGSGKSYLAKALRDLEVDNGGNAPRIHCMDDYFMTEVEKVEDSEGSKSSGSVKGKKQVTRKVMEYCYEPEMEEAYRTSMLKAFKKTVEDGIFTFVIVDDRNLRVADFAQFWAIGKRSGYEVYLLEATYKDPTGCAARNVHGFTLDDINRMAEKWEEAPAFYLQLDVQSLFHGDDLNESNIQEVEMDTEDMPCDDRVVYDRKSPRRDEEISTDNTRGGSATVGERWVTEGEDLSEKRELGKSKWSKDFDEEVDETNDAAQKPNALSGLIQAYGKGGRSVYWGDGVERRGFSIGASTNQCGSSLIIGPGSGYNLKSNPLSEEENPVDMVERNNTSALRKRSVFLEHIHAERESFRAVFDRRRHRIGGFNDVEDE